MNEHTAEKAAGLRDLLWDAVRSVYRRHDDHLPLNHVNVVEWVEAVEAALAEHVETSEEWGVRRESGFVVQTERWRDQVDWLTEHAARGLAQDEGGEVVRRTTTKFVHQADWARVLPPGEGRA